jgi:O-antigen/teichoic acid export membrane protein
MRLRRTRLAREGAWAGASTVLAAIGYLIGMRLVTQVVAPEVLGIVTLLLGMLPLLRGAFCAPVMQGVLRLYPDAAQQGEIWRLRRVAGRLLIWTSIAVLLLLLIGGGAYSHFARLPWLALILTALYFVFEITRTFETDLIQAARRQEVTGVVRASDAWLRPGLIVLAAVMISSTPSTIMGAHALTTVLILVWILLWVRREGVGHAGPKSDRDRQIFRELLRYAIPLAPLALVGWVVGLSDRYLIEFFNGKEAVGIYGATYGLVAYPFLVSSQMVETTLRPAYFEAVSAANKVRENRLFRVWMGLNVAISVLGFVLFWLLHPWIAKFLLAQPFRSGSTLMPWIAGGYVLFVIAQTFERPLYAHKRTHRVLWAQGLAAVACLISEYLLIRKWGIQGAAMAVPCYFGAYAMLTGILIRGDLCKVNTGSR